GYWEDIGTIKSFFEANLSLASTDPPFELAAEEAPIYSRARFLPPSRVAKATMVNSLIADGCQVQEGAVIENSVIGLRCMIERDVVIRNSILMGHDFYQEPGEAASDTTNGHPPLSVGAGTHIEDAIIDKNCRIGRNVRIANSTGADSTEETEFGMIRDGIVCIAKGSTLPDGWTM
ncbi:MAG: glucose-1-phosphate adenylyltransferase, partial [Planctomycetes bacterium]|nr:glucose-1-phosphate adenylyltransferase [Planctomycetota bacterium]